MRDTLYGTTEKKSHGPLRGIRLDDEGRQATKRDPWYVVDSKTNEDLSGTKYYPGATGIELGDMDQWTFELDLVENDIDVEGWIGAAADGATKAVPITKSCVNLTTGQRLGATMVGDTGNKWVIDLQNIGVTHVRFTSPARTNATNSTEIRGVSRKV